MKKVLINIGEFAGVGGPWHLGISDPKHGLVASRRLTNRAIATSSPGAMQVKKDLGHILGPAGQTPLWSTVSVEAASGALADAASTAFCLMPYGDIVSALGSFSGGISVVLVSGAGEVRLIA